MSTFYWHTAFRYITESIASFMNTSFPLSPVKYDDQPNIVPGEMQCLGSHSDLINLPAENFRQCTETLSSLSSSELASNIGHNFTVYVLDAETFCDQCKNSIRISLKSPVCLKCSRCHMICHRDCVRAVDVRCESPPSQSCLFLDMLSVDDQLSPVSSNQLLGKSEEDIDSLESSQNQVVLEAAEKVPDSAAAADASTTTTAASLHQLPSTKCDLSVLDPVAAAALDESEICSQSTLKRNVVNKSSNQFDADSSFSSKTYSATLYYSALQDNNNSTLVSPSDQTPPCIRSRRPKRPVNRRYSFLAPLQSSANTSRLHYDFSSQDDEAISMHGIHVNRNQSPPPSPGDDETPVSVRWASVMQSTAVFASSSSGGGNRRRAKNGDASSNAKAFAMKRVETAPPTDSWTRQELSKRVSVFNANDFGLEAKPTHPESISACQGTIRVHINLLRPVRILLSSPSSDTIDSTDDDFFDLPNCLPGYPPRSAVTADENISPSSNPADDSQPIWIPRGTTRVINVKLTESSSDVIQLLLKRFQIEDNPRKFAIYEHTIDGDQEVSVRRLGDDESPFGLFLHWTGSGKQRFHELLTVKRLVLQENDTGDIDWLGFSLPELELFLELLQREENEYRLAIELKYRLRRKEVDRLLKAASSTLLQSSRSSVLLLDNLGGEEAATTLVDASQQHPVSAPTSPELFRKHSPVPNDFTDVADKPTNNLRDKVTKPNGHHTNDVPDATLKPSVIANTEPFQTLQPRKDKSKPKSSFLSRMFSRPDKTTNLAPDDRSATLTPGHQLPSPTRRLFSRRPSNAKDLRTNR